MSLNQKLQFQSFDSGQTDEDENFSEEDLETARKEGYEAGREAALAEHLASEERRLAQMLEQITQDTARLADTNDQMIADLTNEVLDIAMLAVRKVLPATAAASGLAEIEGLVRQCLTDLRAEPRVAIRLHEISLTALQPRLERLATDSGFDGKLLLLADDALAPTDCQVLWADGGATRKIDDIAETIDAAVTRFLNRDGAPSDDGALSDHEPELQTEPDQIIAEPQGAAEPTSAEQVAPDDVSPDVINGEIQSDPEPTTDPLAAAPELREPSAPIDQPHDTEPS